MEADRGSAYRSRWFCIQPLQSDSTCIAIGNIPHENFEQTDRLRCRITNPAQTFAVVTVPDPGHCADGVTILRDTHVQATLVTE